MSRICLAAALLWPIVALSQRQKGEIRLQVKDPSGAAMPASGKLVSLVQGVERSFRTDEQGRYSIGNLPFGRYRLEISNRLG
jgi:hypothetical protein